MTRSESSSVDNPHYMSWSKEKKGTSVTHKVVVQIRDEKESVTYMTTKLLDFDEFKCVLEITLERELGGNPVFASKIKETLNRSGGLPGGLTPEQYAEGRMQGAKEDGQETVKIGKAEYKTRWFSAPTVAKDYEANRKLWVSSEVPGLTVKDNSSQTIPTAKKFSSSQVLIEIKRP